MSWTPRGSDRRRNTRFEIVGAMRGSAASKEYVLIHNIGGGGALVESHRPLPVDTQVQVKLDPGALAQTIEARIRHVTTVGPATYLIGLEFVVTDRVLAQVQALLGIMV
jgi:hypothetical protein